MEKIFRAIGTGIVIGAVLFFAPGISAFVLGAMIFGISLMVIFRTPRERYFRQRFYERYADDRRVISIDNRWYRSNIESKGLIRDININE